MKNKNGWGMTEMLMLLSILAFFFLVAIILIVKFYSAVDIDLSNTNEISEKSYYELEKELEYAANRYLDNKYENISDLNSITITIEKLKNMGYLENIDFKGCKGYVISSIINGDFISDSYISCDGYKTIGFESGIVNE